MATKRLPMRSIREILRLHLLRGLSYRDVAKSVGVSLGSVSGIVRRAEAKGLDWRKVCDFGDEELERELYGPRKRAGMQRPLPDPAEVHKELRRPGVTLELLHLEYKEQHPDGYEYTAFCDNYRRWLRRRGATMRQFHKAGEKTFVDFSGKKPVIVDRRTGEVTEVELFVSALGASNLIYAEATLSQGSRDWIECHNNAVEYYGGVTNLFVPDQLKSGVSVPCRYEPEINRAYGEWARHYDTVILPARQRKPRDKAKVENAVQNAQRWILARLRNLDFFSLTELNEYVAELLEVLNARPMKSYGGLSRWQLFEQVERAELRPLPSHRFTFAEWKTAKVNIDYHIVFDKHFYSVPHPLVREEVEVRATTMTIEVYRRGKRVASHRRSSVAGGYTTIPEHMPKAHQKHLKWTPTRLISWAATVGPNAEKFATVLIESRPHPEQGYRSCLGLMRLTKTYTNDRVDAACARALAAGARSYRHVKSILKNGLDRVPLNPSEQEEEYKPVEHENVRGPEYYQEEK